jgi:hypothetical protein
MKVRYVRMSGCQARRLMQHQQYAQNLQSIIREQIISDQAIGVRSSGRLKIAQQFIAGRNGFREEVHVTDN